MSGLVHFGVAGWSYPDWRGVVYAKSCRDPLAVVARHVDFIEINTSFYAVPSAATTGRWSAAVADLPTFFTAKVPREITHERRLDAGVLAAFRACLAPLRAGGRLAMLLAQFPHRFRHDAAAEALLEAIAGELGPLAPIALEVRDASWGAARALERVADLGLSLVHLDYPGGFDAAGTALFGRESLAYLRLHGRNRAAWFDPEAGRDAVYDWLYSARESDEVLARLRSIAAAAKATHVVANNHFHGKAMKLILELAAAWRGERVEVPPELLHAYPELRPIATRAQGEMFER